MSSEQRTEHPRVENLVITPVSMEPEGFDLIGAFLCLRFCVEGYSCLFDLTLPAITAKAIEIYSYLTQDTKYRILCKIFIFIFKSTKSVN